MGNADNESDLIRRIQQQGDKGRPSYSEFLVYLDRKARRMGVPFRGQFELTPLCNFDCKMCYSHLTREQMGGKQLLSVEQWKRLIKEAWDAGMLCANLTGGECLTYPGFEELYLYLHELGCDVVVLSNGALLSDKWIRFFQAHKPSMLQVTLYGGDEDVYERVTGRRDFALVKGNLQKARDAGLPLSMCITPSKYLGEGVFDTMRTLKDMGLPYGISDSIMDPNEETGRAGIQHDLGIDYYERIYRFRNELNGVETQETALEKLPPIGGPHSACDARGLTCGAGMSCFTVEWTGRMVPCNSLREVNGWPFEEGFMTVWNRIHQICANWPRVPECEECPYLPVCTNCAAKKERFAERGKQPTALCEQVRYLVSRGVKALPACE